MVQAIEDCCVVTEIVINTRSFNCKDTFSLLDSWQESNTLAFLGLIIISQLAAAVEPNQAAVVSGVSLLRLQYVKKMNHTYT